MPNLEYFYKGKLRSEDVNAMLLSVNYMDGDEPAIIHDGALVKLGDLIPSEVYNVTGITSGINDYNVYAATAPAATTDPVVIVDISDIPHGEINGNTYNIGVKIPGTKSRPGVPVRARIVAPYDRFWLSPDNFTTLPTQGQYAIITAGSTLHTPTATAPTDGSYCIKIVEANKDFTTGTRAVGKLYLCQVVSTPLA